MVCLACLLPLFPVPIVNLLPVLFDYFMAKLYRLFGWEYRRPERAPPVCPMKPIEPKTTLNKSEVADDPNLVPDPSIGVHEGKQD